MAWARDSGRGVARGSVGEGGGEQNGALRDSAAHAHGAAACRKATQTCTHTHISRLHLGDAGDTVIIAQTTVAAVRVTNVAGLNRGAAGRRQRRGDKEHGVYALPRWLAGAVRGARYNDFRLAAQAVNAWRASRACSGANSPRSSLRTPCAIIFLRQALLW